MDTSWKNKIKRIAAGGIVRQIILIVILSVVGLTALKGFPLKLFFIYILLVSLYLIKKVNYFDYILESANKISKGDFSIELREKGDKDLIELAHNINLIKNNYEKALKERLKDEKLKSELILNVSNNLKQPVSSIENYIKLYQNENALGIEKSQYINIIYNKAKELKALIENLFEVSKLNSNKIELNRQYIDIIELIYQVVGEASEGYCEKNIKFIMNNLADEVVIKADGERISRLMEILVSNVLKYSMANTRVYIEVKQNKDKVTISIKNVISCEDKNLNNTPGFGLIIAGKIAELHGGSLRTEREGDLFKVYVFLKS